jgi:RNA polymerase sigma-70 factor, ECF subfamily
MAQRLPPLSTAADNVETAPSAPAQGDPLHSDPLNSGDAAGASIDLSALIVAHHAALYRYAYRLCGCAAEAEDLTQQSFLIAQRKLHQLREADRAAAWLFAVLRSCFLKSLRRQRPATAAALNLEVDQFAGPSPAVDSVDREQLAAALADLPEEFRLVVLMFYFEDLSYQQIAAQLEIPIGTVMSRLSRAKGHLRKRLSDDQPVSPATNHAAKAESKTDLPNPNPARLRA